MRHSLGKYHICLSVWRPACGLHDYRASTIERLHGGSLLMFTVDEKQRAAALGLGSSLLSLGIAGGPPLAGRHQSINQSNNQTINQSVSQSVSQSVNQTINQSIKQSINQSVSQSVNQSINQMTNQSINQCCY